MRIHCDERGQTIILVALSLPLLLGFVGIATDVGALFKDKRTMQTAADAGAIAGALNISNGTYVTAAKAATAANGYTDGSNGVVVNPVNGPLWPASNYHGQNNYIEVTITKTESTIFLALFGYPSVTVQARAVATNQGVGNGCVYTLGTTGPGLSVQGSLDITMPDCAFNINSTSINAVVETGKGGNVQTSSVSAVGDIGTSGWADFHPQPVGGVVGASDPLAKMQYPYTCSSSGCTCPVASSICSTNPVAPMPGSCTTFTYNKNGTTNLGPGCYSFGGGIIKVLGNSTINLSSGVYFFTNGTLQLQSTTTMNATGVTMIMTGTAALDMGGGPTLNISAPDKTGTFPGILYYQTPDDTSSLTLQGGSGVTIEGVFYAPSAAVTMQGTPGGSINADFVAKSLTLAGNPSFHSLADLPGGASVGLHSIALVE